MTTTKKSQYIVKRAFSATSTIGLAVSFGIIIGWYLCHQFVISTGGVWPKVSSLDYVIDIVNRFGGLGAVGTLILVLHRIFGKGRRSDR